MITFEEVEKLFEEQNKAFAKLLSDKIDPLIAQNQLIIAENQILKRKVGILSAHVESLTGENIFDTSADLFDQHESDENVKYATIEPHKKKRSYAAVAALPASTPISLRNKYQKLEEQKEQLQLAEKAKNCVFVGVPEMDSDVNTENYDKTLMHTIMLNADLKPECAIKVFRHGKKTDGKPRILKIKMESEEARESFLKSLRHNRPDTLPKNAYVRRDYTQTELQVDWQLRHECRERNTKSGPHQFLVSDFRIIELKGELKTYNARPPRPTTELN